jgi:Zn-dependent protease with chaperone function
MKRVHITILICLLATLAIVPSAVAQDDGQEEPPGRDPDFEQEIYDRLATIAPEAVPLFQEATRAMDEGDLAAAKGGYERVLELAPDFPDAARRLSYVELGLGNIEAAVERARQAHAAGDSPYNQVALAQALLSTEGRDNEIEALTHAQAAVEALPDDDSANVALLLAGIVNKNEAAVRRASTTLVEVLPEYPLAHFYLGLLAAEDSQWEKAERELLLAQKLGMPAEYVQEALDDRIASEARWSRWRRRGIYALGAWVGGLAVLFGAGVLLSKLTLAAVQRPQPATEFQLGWTERLVRTLYRIVIAITSLYFYASIPILILIVIAVTGGIFYLFLVAGRVPVRLAVFILAAAFYTLYAVLRSIFTRYKDPEPGQPLPRNQAPELWALTQEVAEHVGARPVDAIYVTPAPEIGVMERGNLWRKLTGAGQRCLILGLGALPAMTQGQFKAILAHEYGHFSNRDTAGGNLAHQVRISMHRMAYSLIINGQARWYNPAWLFVNGFYRIFLRITLGASRLQEILADRYAAIAYGVQNFVDGLIHIVRQSLTFNVQASHEVELATKLRRDLSNLYTLPPLESDLMKGKLEARIKEVMSRPTSPYDSHPAVRERIALVQQLEVSKVGESPEPVWDLLPNTETLQREMTAIVQANVKRR